jgi:hypothetical protein
MKGCKGRNFVEIYLCPRCKFKYPVYRRGKKCRKMGHKKTIYCFPCKTLRPFIRVA